jgi:hypothetical protein
VLTGIRRDPLFIHKGIAAPPLSSRTLEFDLPDIIYSLVGSPVIYVRAMEFLLLGAILASHK